MTKGALELMNASRGAAVCTGRGWREEGKESVGRTGFTERPADDESDDATSGDDDFLQCFAQVVDICEGIGADRAKIVRGALLVDIGVSIHGKDGLIVAVTRAYGRVFGFSEMLILAGGDVDDLVNLILDKVESR